MEKPFADVARSLWQARVQYESMEEALEQIGSELGVRPDGIIPTIQSLHQLGANLVQRLLHGLVLNPGLPEALRYVDKGLLHPFPPAFRLRTRLLRYRAAVPVEPGLTVPWTGSEETRMAPCRFTSVSDWASARVLVEERVLGLGQACPRPFWAANPDPG